MTFETIGEAIAQDVHRIEQLHLKYKSLGYLLTPHTKQYVIENKVKQDLKTVVKAVINEIKIPKKSKSNNSKVLTPEGNIH